MTIKFSPTVLSLALAVSALLSNRADAIVAYQLPANPNSNKIVSGAGKNLLGEIFNVTNPISVSAVGAFDNGLDGFGNSTVQVALYQLTGTIPSGTWTMVSGTANSYTGSPTPADFYKGSYLFHKLSEKLVLATGTYAVVGAGFGTASAAYWDYNATNKNPVNKGAEFQTKSSDISMASGNYNFFKSNVSSLPDPFTLGANKYNNWGDPYPAFGAGSFIFSPVPEPGSFGFLAAGLLGTLSVGRFMRRKR